MRQLRYKADGGMIGKEKTMRRVTLIKKRGNRHAVPFDGSRLVLRAIRLGVFLHGAGGRGSGDIEDVCT